MLRMAYLESAIDKTLDDIRLEAKSTGSDASSDAVAGVQQEKMLLSKSSGSHLARYTEIPELAMEVERAVWQVEKSLRSKQELEKERKELESAGQKGSR